MVELFFILFAGSQTDYTSRYRRRNYKNASPQTIDPITADQRGHNKRNRMFTIGHPCVLETKRTVNNEHKKKNCTWSIETHHTCVSQFIEVVFPPQADPIETQGSTIKQHNHTCMVTLD